MDHINEYGRSGASFPMNINGTEYAAYTLRDKDYTELSGYIQSRVIDLARAQLDFATQEERSELLQAAIKAAATVGWGSPEGVRTMRTTEGVLRLGWQMIRKDSKVSFSDFCKQAHGDGSETLLESLLEIDKVFVVLNTILKKDDEDDTDEGDVSESSKSGD